MNSNHILYGLCTFAVLGYAYVRFRPPPEHRWTTTTLKYRSAFIGYASAIVCFFLIFSNSANEFGLPVPTGLIAWVPSEVGNQVKQVLQQGPLTGLPLTTIFLFVPGARKPEEWIRKKFWEIAAIPKQAEILTDLLMTTQYAVPETLQDNIRLEMRTQDLDYEYLLENDGKLGENWIRMVSVFIKLDQLISHEEEIEIEKGMENIAFIRYRNGAWRSIKREYEKQRPVASELFADRMELSADGVDEARSTAKAEKLFLSGYNPLMRDMLRLIICSTMRSVRNMKQVHEEIEEWGFTKLVQPNYGLSIHDCTNLSIFVLLYMGVAFALVRTGESFLSNLLLAVTVAMILVTSILCATVPKTEWPKLAARDYENSDRKPIFDFLSGRKTFAYILSSVAAMAFCFVVLSTYFTLTVDDIETIADKWAVRWPWVLIPFANAFVVACLVDNRTPETQGKWKKKNFREACLAGIFLGMFMLISALLINASDPNKNYEGIQLASMVFVMMAFGFLLGWCALLLFRPAIGSTADRVERSVGTT